MKTVVISQPMYFPWIGIFEQIRLADVFVHYDDVQFSKGSFFNRVQVKTQDGFKWMTVPLKKFSLGEHINTVQPDDENNWKQSHLDLLATCYSGTPFLTEMLELAEGVIQQPHTNLAELSQASIEAVCRYFGLDNECEFVCSSALNITGKSTERVFKVVQHFEGNRYVTGHGARHYFDHELLERNGIRTEYIDYRKKPYPQLHGPFNPFVSVLDLIANVGREGIVYISSPSVYWKLFVERTLDAA